MKGRIAWGTTLGLIIGVIVIGITLFFLTFLVDFDALFLTNQQDKLVKYSTCALAYCSGGGSDNEGLFSDEVLGVGCLEESGTGCDLSCAQVEDTFFELGSESFLDNFGRKHYCGKTNSIPFKFEGLTASDKVPLESGQMDRIATDPWWVCKSLRIGAWEVDEVTGSFPGLSTADWQYHGGTEGIVAGALAIKEVVFPQTCIMLSKANTDTEAYVRAGTFIGALIITPVKGATTALRGTKTIIGAPVKTTSKILPFASSAISKIPTKVVLRLPQGIKEWQIKGATGAGLGIVTDVFAGTDMFELTGLETKGGCFTGYIYDKTDDDLPSNEHLLYTPIIQYYKPDLDSDNELLKKGTGDLKVYPSAIYVDQSFTNGFDGFEPECEFFNPETVRKEVLLEGKLTEEKGNFINQYRDAHARDYKGQIVELYSDSGEKLDEREITDDEINALLESDALEQADLEFGEEDPIVGIDFLGPVMNEFKFGNMVRSCNFRTTDAKGEKIEYKVWATPTFPTAGTVGTSSYLEYDTIPSETGITIDQFSAFTSEEPGFLDYESFEVAFVEIIDIIAETLGLPSSKDQLNAFSSFGSCAYVTLDRELDTSKINEDDESEFVKNIYVSSEKSDYNFGEIVRFDGKLEIDDGSSEGREIELELNQIFEISPISVPVIQKVITDENGEFFWEVELGGQGKIDYEIKAEYNGIESELFKFTVG